MEKTKSIGKFIIVLAVLIIFTAPLYAEYTTGAGIYAGVPTGLRLKTNLNNSNSLAATFAYDLPGSMMYASLDYFYNFRYYARDADSEVPFFIYAGPGFRVKTNDANVNSSNDVHAGVKFNIGAGFMFSEIPIELFLEVSPILDIIPATDFDMNAGVGFIFYFM
ncbi:MAG: hypothetical protein R6U31_07655 [bacterium]